ncbi:hypothetical protein ACFQVA_16505 [Actinomadura keratinilytica]
MGNGLFTRFLDLAEQHDAHMTFFLSGLYLLPESKKRLYSPPNNPVGASDIGYLTDAHIKDTLAGVRRAWLDGHEIGTHFNGHFCGGSGSVANWTPAQWGAEIEQAKAFVQQWRTHTGWEDEDPLPFDYDKELVGGRTPACSARTTCCRRPANWAGGTTPPRPAASRPGRSSARGCGTCPCRPCPSRGAPSRRSRWTTTSCTTSPRTPPRARPATTRPGASRRPARTWPVSAGRTSRTARPCSSATTSRSGTAASTWTPSRSR